MEREILKCLFGADNGKEVVPGSLQVGSWQQTRMGAAKTAKDHSIEVEKGAVKVTMQPYLSRAEEQKEGICKVNVIAMENSVEKQV